MEQKARLGWDDYFMEISRVVARRATCDRKHVGAVIVRDRRILATGYNGSIPGSPHCDEVGHKMEDGHCVRTIHAEVNALLQAARHGVSVRGAWIYVTCSPCLGCFKAIVTAGIVRIGYGEAYRSDVWTFAEDLGLGSDFCAVSAPGVEAPLQIAYLPSKDERGPEPAARPEVGRDRCSTCGFTRASHGDFDHAFKVALGPGFAAFTPLPRKDVPEILCGWCGLSRENHRDSDHAHAFEAFKEIPPPRKG